MDENMHSTQKTVNGDAIELLRYRFNGRDVTCSDIVYSETHSAGFPAKRSFELFQALTFTFHTKSMRTKRFIFQPLLF